MYITRYKTILLAILICCTIILKTSEKQDNYIINEAWFRGQDIHLQSAHAYQSFMYKKVKCTSLDTKLFYFAILIFCTIIFCTWKNKQTNKTKINTFEIKHKCVQDIHLQSFDT